MTPKRLGIFVRDPVPGAVKTRLAPPLSPEEACALYEAFLRDLFRRVQALRSVRVTVFRAGEAPDRLAPLVPGGWAVEPQRGADLGQRLAHATDRLLAGGARAVVIGSDSPDVPVQTIRRAFQRIKHKDVAVGPASDGGYYLVGLRAPAPGLFEGVPWGTPGVLEGTLANIERLGLSLAVLPVWYDVDDDASLDLLRQMATARRLERGGRLHAVEAVLERLGRPSDP